MKNPQKPEIHVPYGPYETIVKRPLDIVLSCMALFLFSPLLLCAAVLIKVNLGSPVLFRQERTGRNGKTFKMMKFRSMTEERDEKGIYLPDEKRITGIGRFLRKTSIDELPSLINVIKGDMSIIGPRPLPVRYYDRYTDQQKRRLEVRPGLSSPSVARGRNQQTWEEQFYGDVQYVDHISFLVDLKTVVETLRIVMNHKGATADDGGCRGEFIGKADIDELGNDAEGNYMKIKKGKDL